MSKTRPFRFAALAAITILATTFATLPTTADDDAGAEPAFLVTLEVTSTVPRVAGVVTVTAPNGTAVGSAIVDVTSTSDLVSAAPAARTIAVTNQAGDAAFSFGYATTAAVPGDHTLTVVVTKGDRTETATFGYSVPQA